MEEVKKEEDNNVERINDIFIEMCKPKTRE